MSHVGEAETKETSVGEWGGGVRLLIPWSHFMVGIDVCLEKRRGDSGVKQVLCNCIVEATRRKCGDGGVSQVCG